MHSLRALDCRPILMLKYVKQFAQIHVKKIVNASITFSDTDYIYNNINYLMFLYNSIAFISLILSYRPRALKLIFYFDLCFHGAKLLFSTY